MIDYSPMSRPLFLVGGPANLITHEVDGILVPEDDERALAAALWRLRSDSALRRRLGEAGRAKVERSYEAKLVTRQLLTELGIAA